MAKGQQPQKQFKKPQLTAKKKKDMRDIRPQASTR